MKLVIIIFVSFFLATPVIAANLNVPFTSQAPYANWSQPWQDACEESTIVMVDHFYAGKKLDKKTAREAILKALRIKENKYGWSLDENAEKIVNIINDYYPWEARVVLNPSLAQIKSEIDNNRPVILPAHGKFLYNPYFQQGGPDYHTVVISGYDDESSEFITQEPGTRHGLDFRYSYDRIMNAMHDFAPGKNTKTGRKIAIFTSRNLDISALTDADADGLSKLDEMRTGTVLWLADSDGDGYDDGAEVNAGYSPTLAEPKLESETLIKSANSPKVYVIQDGEKRHVASEQSFLSRGWRWADIFVVSSKFLSALREGLALN